MFDEESTIEQITDNFIKLFREQKCFIGMNGYESNITQCNVSPQFPIITFDANSMPDSKLIESIGIECPSAETIQFSIVLLTDPTTNRSVANREHQRFRENIKKIFKTNHYSDIDSRIMAFKFIDGVTIKITDPNTEIDENTKIYANASILNYSMDYNMEGENYNG
ncbi:MAG: hypothetical protein LBU40_04105 [Methanobrevibacter sp.]|jgi:ribosomal protein S16|nr:hypothetical protein [Methanobrevibacter sp.]